MCVRVARLQTSPSAVPQGLAPGYIRSQQFQYLGKGGKETHGEQATGVGVGLWIGFDSTLS